MNYVKEYANFLRQFINTPNKVRVLFDSSNGSTGMVLKELYLNHSQVEAVFVNDNPDGEFPAHGANPLTKGAIDDVGQAVLKTQVDIGAVFDGDGDRVFFFDEKGSVLSSYESFRCIKGGFNPPYVLDSRALAEFTMPNEQVVQTKVGYYFIRKAMGEHNAELGAEYTGHFYFKNFFYADSGILAAVYMINYLSSLKGGGKALSEVGDTEDFIRLPEVNFKVSSPEGAIDKLKAYFVQDKQVRISELDGLTVYAQKFALNIRASATEPLLRFTLVAKDKKVLKTIAGKVEGLLGKDE